MSLVLVTAAAAFAADAHRAQQRKITGEPYIGHPLRVAAEAAACGLSPEAVAAACLHDVIEDCGVTAGELEARFGPKVRALVVALTQTWADDAPPEKRDMLGHMRGILAAPEALELKLLDRADNLDDMALAIAPIGRGWPSRYLAKTRRDLEPHAQACRNAPVKARFESALAGLERALEAAR